MEVALSRNQYGHPSDGGHAASLGASSITDLSNPNLIITPTTRSGRPAEYLV